MPDINQALDALTSAIPDLFGAFVRGVQYAVAGFILIGIIYFLRRYL